MYMSSNSGVNLWTASYRLTWIGGLCLQDQTTQSGTVSYLVKMAQVRFGHCETLSEKVLAARISDSIVHSSLDGLIMPPPDQLTVTVTSDCRSASLRSTLDNGDHSEFAPLNWLLGLFLTSDFLEASIDLMLMMPCKSPPSMNPEMKASP